MGRRMNWIKLNDIIEISEDGNVYRVGLKNKVLISAIFLEDLTQLIGATIYKYDLVTEQLIFNRRGDSE